MSRVHTREMTDWVEALLERHLADLTFAELRRGLQALSVRYVERRRAEGAVDSGATLDGTAKRAAFAVFYAPLHLMVVRRIVRALGAAAPAPRRIVDLGCGSGAAAVGWGLELAAAPPPLTGIDRSRWAVAEARWTWHWFGLHGRARQGDLSRVRLPQRGGAILLAYVANELRDAPRERLLRALVAAGSRGARILVVEPIARRAVPWWERWVAALAPHGARADTWRFRAELPAPLRRLDRAAGLRHRELTARSLYLAGRSD